MRVIDYPTADAIDSSDFILIDGKKGTRKIPANMSETAWVSHRNIYRGKNLGDTFTDEQKARIEDGTFEDLYVGDYWEIDGVEYDIVDINYWMNTGNVNLTNPVTKNHLVIMPRNGMTNCKYETSGDVSTTGYLNSSVRTETLKQLKATISKAFGESNILVKTEIFSSTLTSNQITAAAYVEDSDIELPSQIMMYGSAVYPLLQTLGYTPFAQTYDTTQLSLFRLRPDYLLTSNQKNYWLRDLSNSKRASYQTSFGGTYIADVSNANVLARPVFGITG